MRDQSGASPPRTVLVTGAAGFIGLLVVRRLRALGLRVIAVDDGSAQTLSRLSRSAGDPQVTVRVLDIRHREAVMRLMSVEQPWAVMHLAAHHFIPDCEQHPAHTLEVNVLGTQHLLDACAENPPQRFIFTSTADVYRPSSRPHQEDDAAGPSGVYGGSKLLAEWLLRDQGDLTQMIIARLFNVYGPGDPHPHLIPELITQSMSSDVLHLGDLGSARDYVYVEDAAEALVTLLHAGTPGTFNVGTGRATTGRELTALVEELIGHRLEVRIDPSRLRTVSRPMSCSNPSRFRGLAQWWPRTPLIEGLQETLSSLTPRVAVHSGGRRVS